MKYLVLVLMICSLIFFSSCHENMKDEKVYVYSPNSIEKYLYSRSQISNANGYHYFFQSQEEKQFSVISNEDKLVFSDNVYDSIFKEIKYEDKVFNCYLSKEQLGYSHATTLVFNHDYGLLAILHDRPFLILKDSVSKSDSHKILSDITERTFN